MTPGELAERLAQAADDVRATAARAGANAMAMEFVRELVGVTLRESSHPPGTKTPAAPGSPPSLVTGTLRRSVRPTPAVSSGTRAIATAAPHTVYARIQEKGGTIHAKRFPQLGNPTVGFFGPQVTLPARPYMKPTRDVLVASGRFHDVCQAAWGAIVLEALG